MCIRDSLQYFGKKNLDLESKYTNERDNSAKLVQESKEALEGELESQKMKAEKVQEELFVSSFLICLFLLLFN